MDSYKYQWRIDTVNSSWWWAHGCPKHVEKWNKYIKQNWVPSWTYLQDNCMTCARQVTRWFKYDRNWFVCKQAAQVPVIFEPPCILPKPIFYIILILSETNYFSWLGSPSSAFLFPRFSRSHSDTS